PPHVESDGDRDPDVAGGDVRLECGNAVGVLDRDGKRGRRGVVGGERLVAGRAEVGDAADGDYVVVEVREGRTRGAAHPELEIVGDRPGGADGEVEPLHGGGLVDGEVAGGGEEEGLAGVDD